MRRDVPSLAAVLLWGSSPAAAVLLPWLSVPFVKRPDRSTWTPPRQTDALLDGNADLRRGWSPRPTAAPRPMFGAASLERRLDGFTMGANTCGFVASEWSA